MVEEFLSTFEEHSATISGMVIPIFSKLISKVYGILDRGRDANSRVIPFGELLDLFHLLGEERAKPLTNGDGNNVARWVMKYFTCEGEFANLQGKHLCILFFL